MLCLCTNEAVPYSAVENSQETKAMVENLANSQAHGPVPKTVALFWFAATLVEEVGKTDSNSMKQFSQTI